MRSRYRWRRVPCLVTAALACLLFACGDDGAAPEAAAPPSSLLIDGGRDTSSRNTWPPGAWPPDKASGDPGRPDTVYGPKAGATLFVEEQQVGYLFFSALAPKNPDQAHLFARVDLGSGEGLRDAYLSLVMDRTAWHVGEYPAALGGRVRIVLKDGRTYAGDARNLTVQLNITIAGPGDFEEHYLTGTGTMTVPSTQAGLPPLTGKLTINAQPAPVDASLGH